MDGRYTVCRWLQLTEGGAMIADDNAVVSCYATPTQLSSLPALQPAMQRGCVRLMDALAYAHPPRYWGNRFWTVHRSSGVDPMVRLTAVSGIRAR